MSGFSVPPLLNSIQRSRDKAPACDPLVGVGQQFLGPQLHGGQVRLRTIFGDHAVNGLDYGVLENGGVPPDREANDPGLRVGFEILVPLFPVNGSEFHPQRILVDG